MIISCRFFIDSHQLGIIRFLHAYAATHFINNLDLLGHSYWALCLDMVLNSFYDTNNSFIALPPLSFVVNDKAKSAIWQSNA